MSQNATPSSSVLRKLLSSIAADLGQAPLRTSSHATLVALTRDFAALERAMAATSDTVSAALAHANDLIDEAARWQSIAAEGGLLATSLERAMSRVEGAPDLRASAAVSARVAHP